jgi:hypothetical protein
MGTGSFPEVKRRGRGVDNPLHLESRLKKEKNYNSTPSLGLRGLLQGELAQETETQISLSEIFRYSNSEYTFPLL